MFRTEAIEAQKQKLHGDVFLTQSLPFYALTVLIGGIVLLLFGLLVAGTYARSEHVGGYLVPSKGLVKIQASQFGTLETLMVHEGDQVKKGDILATIQVSMNTLDGGTSAERALDALARQQVSLKTQLTLEQNQLDADTARLKSEKADTGLNIKSLEQQLVLQRQITASAETAYKDAQELREHGYISKVESERRRQTWLAQQAQAQLKAQELASAKAKLDQIEIRLDQLPIESEQRVARLKSQALELDARQAELEGRRAYAVTAPIDGRVVSVSAAGIGRTMQAGQALVAIMPEGSVLEAELYVPSRAAGFVAEGQEVRLMYDAFPYQRFGSFPATVTQVSETILSPTELLAPFEVREPVYRVTAVLTDDSITTQGRSIAFQSGMTLQANIILERRSFLDWLLEPLRAVRDRT